MDKCEKCLNRRMIVSENGYHFICSLSNIAAMNCILDKKDHFIPQPIWATTKIGNTNEYKNKT